MRSPRQLDYATRVRLQVAQLPKSIDCVLADTPPFSHEPTAQMCHALRLAIQGRVNDLGSFALVEFRLASSTRGNLPQLFNAARAHSLMPHLRRRPTHAKLLCDRDVVITTQSSEHNPAARQHLLRSTLGRLSLSQLRPLARCQLGRQLLVQHERDHSNARKACMHICGTRH